MPVIRARSSLVLVDVVVSDKHNRLITNLGPKDFKIFEDEVRQELVSVQVVKPEVSASLVARRARADEATAEQRGDGRGHMLSAEPRYVVILLDYATTKFENQVYIRAAAKKYFRERLNPGSRVALVRVGLGLQPLQGFTEDPEKLVAALDHVDLSGSSYAGDQELLQGIVDGARREQSALMSQLNSLVADPTAGSGGRAGSGGSMIEARLSAAQHRESETYALQSFARQQQSRPILEAIRSIADAVAPLPGRKTLVLVSQGFSIPGVLEPLLDSTVQAANRARMAIYALDSRGLEYKEQSRTGELHSEIGALYTGNRQAIEFGESIFDRARQVGSDQQDSTLRFLASATGGRLIRHTNNFEAAFGRIEQESGLYYLLSYQPRNLAYDGRFRPIRVTVNRAGLEVRARAGYFAMPAGASMLAPAEFREILKEGNGTEAPDFPLYLEPAHFLEGDGSYTVELTAEVPLAGVGFERDQQAYLFPLQVFGIVRDSSGEVRSSFRAGGPVRLSPEEVQAAQQGSLTFSSRLRLAPGRYAVELVAFDPVRNHRSYRRTSLQLEPVEKGLAVSTLVLSHHVEPAKEIGFSPWTVGKVRIFPSADHHFRSHQELIFYLTVYYPGLRPGEGRSDVEVRLSLVRDGRPLQVPLPAYQLSEIEPAPMPHLQLARYLKLERLPPGAYVLRARVEDRVRGRSVTTQAPFELER